MMQEHEFVIKRVHPSWGPRTFAGGREGLPYAVWYGLQYCAEFETEAEALAYIQEHVAEMQRLDEEYRGH